HYAHRVTDVDAETAPDSDAEEATGQGFAGAPVTAALFMTNIGVYVAEAWLAPDWRWAIAGPDPSDQRKWDHLLRWLGANASLWTIADNRLETLVTSCFLHASLLHLALNLLILHQV